MISNMPATLSHLREISRRGYDAETRHEIIRSPEYRQSRRSHKEAGLTHAETLRRLQWEYFPVP